MIPTKGLTENLLPNMYLKNVTLNSNFTTGPTTTVKTMYGTDDDPAIAAAGTTQTVSDIGTANITLSVKFVE